MFHHENPHRTDVQNRVLAGWLAAVAGFVNSAGFVFIGSFSSHVTGNVGRFANDLALRDAPAAISAITLLLAFFGGAVVSSWAVESHVFGRRPALYGVLLFAEAALLGGFVLATSVWAPSDPRAHDLLAAILCVAMGMQNSLITRLSGAVVRTTHLTGTVTDLGIEVSRWLRHWRARAEDTLHLKLSIGDAPRSEPSWPKTALLLVIVGTFIGGGAAGALAAVHFQQQAFLLPIAALIAAGTYALSSDRVRRLPR